MDITQISIILSLLSCILSIILLPFTLYALILVKSLEKQTHTVQFMPVDQALNEEFEEAGKDFDKINKEQQEENEDIYRMI
jgi:membrane protein insertase Oxa1/YidC/SpoIIIJ